MKSLLRGWAVCLFLGAWSLFGWTMLGHGLMAQGTEDVSSSASNSSTPPREAPSETPQKNGSIEMDTDGVNKKPANPEIGVKDDSATDLGDFGESDLQIPKKEGDNTPPSQDQVDAIKAYFERLPSGQTLSASNKDVKEDLQTLAPLLKLSSVEKEDLFASIQPYLNVAHNNFYNGIYKSILDNLDNPTRLKQLLEVNETAIRIYYNAYLAYLVDKNSRGLYIERLLGIQPKIMEMYAVLMAQKWSDSQNNLLHLVNLYNSGMLLLIRYAGDRDSFLSLALKRDIKSIPFLNRRLTSLPIFKGIGNLRGIIERIRSKDKPQYLFVLSDYTVSSCKPPRSEFLSIDDVNSRLREFLDGAVVKEKDGYQLSRLFEWYLGSDITAYPPFLSNWGIDVEGKFLGYTPYSPLLSTEKEK